MGGQCGGPTQVEPQTFASSKGLEDATEPGHHKDQKENPKSKIKPPLPPNSSFPTGQGYRELELGKTEGLGRVLGRDAVGS